MFVVMFVHTKHGPSLARLPYGGQSRRISLLYARLHAMRLGPGRMTHLAHDAIAAAKGAVAAGAGPQAELAQDHRVPAFQDLRVRDASATRRGHTALHAGLRWVASNVWAPCWFFTGSEHPHTGSSMLHWITKLELLRALRVSTTHDLEQPAGSAGTG